MFPRIGLSGKIYYLPFILGLLVVWVFNHCRQSGTTQWRQSPACFSSEQTQPHVRPPRPLSPTDPWQPSPWPTQACGPSAIQSPSVLLLQWLRRSPEEEPRGGAADKLLAQCCVTIFSSGTGWNSRRHASSISLWTKGSSKTMSQLSAGLFWFAAVLKTNWERNNYHRERKVDDYRCSSLLGQIIGSTTSFVPVLQI